MVCRSFDLCLNICHSILRNIFSEDSEFLRNAQNAAAHRNRGAGYNPFGMNMNSSASTRNVGRSSSGRDFRRNILIL